MVAWSLIWGDLFASTDIHALPTLLDKHSDETGTDRCHRRFWGSDPGVHATAGSSLLSGTGGGAGRRGCDWGCRVPTSPVRTHVLSQVTILSLPKTRELRLESPGSDLEVSGHPPVRVAFGLVMSAGPSLPKPERSRARRPRWELRAPRTPGDPAASRAAQHRLAANAVPGPLSPVPCPQLGSGDHSRTLTPATEPRGHRPHSCSRLCHMWRRVTRSTSSQGGPTTQNEDGRGRPARSALSGGETAQDLVARAPCPVGRAALQPPTLPAPGTFCPLDVPSLLPATLAD